jgi:hypothetical protein
MWLCRLDLLSFFAAMVTREVVCSEVAVQDHADQLTTSSTAYRFWLRILFMVNM